MCLIFFYLCVLSVVTTGEQQTFTHPVGYNLTFDCPIWDVWTTIGSNAKYICESPCENRKHNIVKAEPGQNKTWNRLFIQNKRESGLTVTFFNLQKSDSKVYVCGLERYGFDAYTEVKIIVSDDFTTRQTTTHFVNKTMNSTFSPNSASEKGNGSVPFLITGVILLSTLTTLLILKRKKNRSFVLNHEDQPAAELDIEDTTAKESVPHNPLETCPPVSIRMAFSDLNLDALYVNSNIQSSSAASVNEQCASIQDTDFLYSLLQLDSLSCECPT